MNGRGNIIPGLWGAIYVRRGTTVECLQAGCELLAPVCEHIVLLASQVDPALPRRADILVPRARGSLAAWIGLWQDTPAQGVIWLAGPLPGAEALPVLAGCHGNARAMAHEKTFSAYFSRACQGVGQRLYAQGGRELQPLLKVLKAPCFSD